MFNVDLTSLSDPNLIQTGILYSLLVERVYIGDQKLVGKTIHIFVTDRLSIPQNLHESLAEGKKYLLPLREELPSAELLKRFPDLDNSLTE